MMYILTVMQKATLDDLRQLIQFVLVIAGLFGIIYGGIYKIINKVTNAFEERLNLRLGVVEERLRIIENSIKESKSKHEYVERQFLKMQSRIECLTGIVKELYQQMFIEVMTEHLSNGERSQEESEKMAQLYRSYTKLGLNGNGKDLYTAFLRLPRH